MGLWGGLARSVQATTYPPDHDFWYQPVTSFATDAGIPVNESVALTVSAVYQATRLISETLGSLSRRLYRRLEGRDKQDAPEHWATPLLIKGRANGRHTAQEWFELMTACALLWGDGFSKYLVSRGQITGLWPLHPSRVTVTEVSTGRLAYVYRNPATNRDESYTQDEIFQLRGFGTGVRGYSIITQARQAIGLARAMESHGARVFSQGTRLSGILTAPGTLPPEAEQRNRESWHRAHRGLGGAHSIAVLSGGMDFKAIGMSQEDAQYIASRDFQVRDVCRWFNLSEHMLRVAQRPIYATPEQLLIELMELTIRPWVVRWEQGLNADLVEEPYFLEFNLDSVHRADLAVRTAYFASAIQNGYRTRNEVRALENLEPLPGLDAPLTPANMQQGTGPEPAPTTGGPPRQESADDPEARASRLLRIMAERAWSRERTAVRTEGTPTHLADGDRWRAWVASYYARHAAYLSESLALPLDAVRPYCAHHRAELLAEGTGILTTWERDAVAELAALGGT